ncbi:2-oxoglutarate-dependent dioxygenase 11-like isoform X2 [Miscanthus floridulus]|uniref:2-oxoglutarate-dependent dioxygenase 11-like isoform X2 n=1 Tax=Miscanthus floridulus TaxID=154761 RepID=UPI003458A5DF
METEAAPSSSGSRWSRVASSLPVRNVQDLAACPEELTAKTLERYIRPDIQNHEVLVEKSSEVPVIDLDKLFNPCFVEEEVARLRFACEDWGFFQLVNHGIPDEIITNIRSDIQSFFQLPLKVKCAYAQVPGSLQGYGQSFVASEGQKLDWCDRFAIIAQPPQVRDMKYWPTQPHTFRKSINDYSSELMKIVGSVVHFIAKTLNIDLKLMDDKYVSQVLRMNYYPPCMTMAEKIVSNGNYKSVEHRVTINANQERLTISAFHIPSLDGVVAPVTSIAEERILYKTMGVEEYLKIFMSNKLEGKRALDHAKLS